MATHDEDEAKRPQSIPAEKARQGRIVLNTPARRIIFFGGLVGLLLLGLLLRFCAAV